MRNQLIPPFYRSSIAAISTTPWCPQQDVLIWLQLQRLWRLLAHYRGLSWHLKAQSHHLSFRLAFPVTIAPQSQFPSKTCNASTRSLATSWRTSANCVAQKLLATRQQPIRAKLPQTHKQLKARKSMWQNQMNPFLPNLLLLTLVVAFNCFCCIIAVSMTIFPH